MARGKRKNKKRKNNKSLSGVGQAHGAKEKMTIKDALVQGGLILAAAIAAGGAGAALGRHSLITGIPVTLFGIYRKNRYITAAGLGLCLSNGFQRQGQTTQGVDGFDIKQIAEQAKDRVGTFFDNFKEKLYLPKGESTGTAGLGENGEQVTYFVNPYNNSKELDMSAIDRVQEQIAEMNRPVNGDLSEVEREF